MALLEGFRPGGEVEADDRGRLPMKKLGVSEHSRYAVAIRADGTLLLTPVASIPARELLVWENAEVRASLFRGLAEAAEGKRGKRLDWVTEDVDLDEPDE